jgi:hypothetical protein
MKVMRIAMIGVIGIIIGIWEGRLGIIKEAGSMSM